MAHVLDCAGCNKLSSVSVECIHPSSSVPAIMMSCRDDDKVKRALLRLNEIYEMPYYKIAREIGIPAGTLWDIAHGKPVPRKWRRKLGLRRAKDLYAMPVKELRWAIENRERVT